MSDTGPGASSSGRGSRMVEILFVLAALATLATFGFFLTDRATSERGTQPRSSSTGPSSTYNAPSTSGAPPSPAIPALLEGTCLVDSLDAEVPCDRAHAYEVISTTECTTEALIRFLGGRPDVEVLRVEPMQLAVPAEREACVVAPPSPEMTLRSVRDALQEPGGAVWRRCADARTANDSVPCNEPHTAEFVLVESSTAVDCIQVSENYTGAPLSRLKGSISVETVSYADGPHCLLVVQGGELLSDTLRNIGTATLPLIPA